MSPIWKVASTLIICAPLRRCRQRVALAALPLRRCRRRAVRSEIGPYRRPDFHADTADRSGPSVAPEARHRCGGNRQRSGPALCQALLVVGLPTGIAVLERFAVIHVGIVTT